MRLSVFGLKDFPAYFFCRTAKKLSRLKMKRQSLILEGSVPDIDKNRRIVSIAKKNKFLFYLRSLRDSFLDDDRFHFTWGGFQAGGSKSLLVFPDLIKNKKILLTMENPKMPDRIPWFSRLAYCQWTLDEMRNGDVWRHFQPSVERLLEKR